MPSLILFFFFILGTIIGSFLNVVVLRYGTKKLSGRSHCFSCGKTLRWFELVPLLSFFAGAGRCRGCKGRISWQYPLVEFVTGAVFVAIAFKNLQPITYNLQPDTPFLWVIVGCELLVWSLLISLSVYDLKHKIIPNALVYSACAVSFLLFLYAYFILHTSYFIDLWSGFLFALPLVALWFFSKGRAMGLGDAKLVVLFPWLLGFAKGLSALIIGFWFGAIVGLFTLLLKASLSFLPKHFCPALRSRVKNIGMKSELPLGPFLVLGLFLVYLYGWDVTGLGMLLGTIDH